MTEKRYCKRLIEVDLPIKRISECSRYEKSVRHGHISTLHIWWARRPLSACRSVILAALLPDPADSYCPEKFKEFSMKILSDFRDKRGGPPRDLKDPMALRAALLDFIADFADWNNASNLYFCETSQKLVQVAYESMGNDSNKKPLVIDPFAGGGAIPLEAMRVGADVFASDINSIPVLLNKILLEYLPKYRSNLTEGIKSGGEWIKKELVRELKDIYPKDKDGSVPIAYLWARNIICEGPNCGATVPMKRSLLLAERGKKIVALELNVDKRSKKVAFAIKENILLKDVGVGTIKRGAVTCPVCGYTTPITSVRKQLHVRKGGANDATLLAIVVTRPGVQGRFYRLPNEIDFNAIKRATQMLKKMEDDNPKDCLSIIPNEVLPLMSGVFNAPIYGHTTWGSLFSTRQNLAMAVLVKLIKGCGDVLGDDKELIIAVQTCLSLAASKATDLNNSLCTWRASSECVDHLFARQAIPIIWDFAEAVLSCNSTGSWESMYNRSLEGLQSALLNNRTNAHVEKCSATQHLLPDDSAAALITDPPYYNAIPYADLSDFFYVWLKRMLGNIHPELLSTNLSPKDEEICEMSGWDPDRYAHKDNKWFENQMKKAMEEGRRVLAPSGIGVVVFANKSTKGWEAQLQAMIDAGWVITGSWPIDTEMGSRVRAMNSAALASSIHLVCRPRENIDGSLRTNEIGDWRDVLHELPKRIHEWMPRLAQEGVVGADAIFACLGPALEVFSKYSQVEKANGEKVELREYLEQVWAAVAKEALNMIFQGAHTEGFEEDARLTAMWLWTLTTGFNENIDKDLENGDDIDAGTGTKVKITGFSLEFDAARKIAQGLGAHLENLSSLVEINGDQARLLPVAERVNFLFGKGSTAATPGRKKKKENQMTLFEEFNKVEEQGWSLGDEKSAVGKTILDRLHQAMILFGAGRGDAMRRFLVDEGIGKDERFWRLAQAFSALYPSNTDEKRWVDGVLARKKSLGF